MRTKPSEGTPSSLSAARRPASAPGHTGAIAYWLDDEAGRRVSKLFAKSEKPLMLAGRILENTGTLVGWTVSSRDAAGVRQMVASGADLEAMAAPFMPVRTLTEVKAVGRLNAVRRATGFRRPHTVGDERIY